MKNTIPFYHSRGKLLFLFLSFFISQGFAQDNRAFYAGSSGKESFNDIVELSDGTLLVSGQADDLDWISISKTKINNSDISNPTPANNYGFILHLSSDMSQILSCAYLDLGIADDIKAIKFQNVPGTTTSNIFISGNTSSGYFLARLNNNFLNGVPDDFSWIHNVSASGYPKSYHPWDVDNQGNVFYISGESHGYNWASIQCLDNTGNKKPIPNWRTHWTSNGEVYGTLAELGLTENDVTHSGIVLKFWGRGDLRSWTQSDYETVIPDGNGGTKQGKWPMDVLFDSPWNPIDKPTGSPGYTGYSKPATPVYGGSAIVIDKRTNHLYIGMNTKSVLPGGNPDFEPAVFAMDNSGALLWWSRLYHEITPSGEIRNSTPDQYIDQLEIDYSQPASQSNLVVLARCHGNNVENFWEGNTIAANPTANGFQNQFTGNSGNIHISWLGKLSMTDGQLNTSTYVAEFAEGMSGTSGTHSDPNLDGWPSPNAGWPTVNTTRCSDLEVASDGSVCVTCKGRRTITTANAYQKMVKPAEGNGTWNQFVRQYSADLSNVQYSSLVVGDWDISNGTGGDNTEISGILSKGNSILAVGKHKDDGGAGYKGNPIPVTGVPSWGENLPENESALSVKYSTGPSDPEEGLPSPWENADIGNVAATGDATYANSTFTLEGSGNDIWGSNDEFHFVYQSLNGDGEIVAKVNSLSNTNSWAKAGVMIRENLDANSKHAMSVITPGNGISFQRRTNTGSSSSSTKIGGITTPVWVKMNRSDDVFTASYSNDGSNWTELGNVTINMSANAYVGLCLTSHNDGTIATTTMDNVSVNTGGTNAAPIVSITSPSDNASFNVGDDITISATATDSDGSISLVEFFDGTTSLGIDNSAPFEITLNNVSTGNYALSAVATDNDGANTTSSVVNISVSSSQNQTFTAFVNQEINGGQWNAVGTLPFIGGTDVSVTIRTDNTNGYVIADAVMFSKAGQTDIIMDNSDASGISTTGSWSTSSHTGGYIGANYFHDGNNGKGSKSITYTYNMPSSGDYEVFLRWTANGNRADNVPVDITYEGNGSANARVSANSKMIKNSKNQPLSLTVFPNPTKAYFNIQMKGKNADWQIRLLDLSGRVHVEKQGNLKDVKNTIQVDVTHFSAGMYILETIIGGKSKIQKVIISR